MAARTAGIDKNEEIGLRHCNPTCTWKRF